MINGTVDVEVLVMDAGFPGDLLLYISHIKRFLKKLVPAGQKKLDFTSCRRSLDRVIEHGDFVKERTAL